MPEPEFVLALLAIEPETFKYKIYLTYLVNKIYRIWKMAKIIEIGKVSSRGQIAVPADIRRELDLKEGERVVFFLDGDTLLVKKVKEKTFAEITRPLREAKKNIREEEVTGLIHKLRKKWR